MLKHLLAIVCIVALANQVRAAQSTLAAETPQQRDQRMGWWREARFGMFIHWGLYAVPAGEWNGKKSPGIGEWIMNNAGVPIADYEKLVGEFNPVKFDARQWARTAKDAGVRYIVITSKHHDGFGLFDSKAGGYNVAATPFKRDILKELSEACAAEGIRMCWYHSIMDWHHPDAQSIGAPKYNNAPKNPNFPRYVENYLKPQLKELLTNYGKIGVIWFDGEWIGDWTEPMARDMVGFLRGLQPDLIINNRVGKGRQGMMGMSKDPTYTGDFGTPEQEIPATGFPGVDWESCMTMNDTWGFRKDDNNWKSSTTLIRMLIDTASKGGNFLLNIGPTAEGQFPDASVQRLADMGRWTKVNGESIYGSSASPFKKVSWGRATQRAGKVYLHVFDWPKDGQLGVPLTNKVSRAYFLANPAQILAVTTADTGATIKLPAAAPDPIATVIVMEIDGQPQVLAATPGIRQAADGSIKLSAADAEILGGTAKLESKDDQPNIGFWTDAADSVQWQVLVDKPGTFTVELNFACEEPSAGSTYDLIIAGQKLSGTVAATKGWSDFTTAKVGAIKIEKAGSTTIAIKPTKKAGLGVMNLRGITLQPAK